VLAQTGHLIAVKSELGMRYYIYRNESNRYDNVAIDFNSVRDYGLLPYGTIDFKVERVEDEDGRAVWFGNKIESSGIGNAEKDNATKEEDVIHNVVSKVQGNLKRLGLFNGAMMVCTAAELYDGTYILMSKPTLLCPPNITSKEAMGNWNTELRNNTSTPTSTDVQGNKIWNGASGICDEVVTTSAVGAGFTSVMNDVRSGIMTALPCLLDNTRKYGYGTLQSFLDAAKKGAKEYSYDKEVVDDDNFMAYSIDVWSALNENNVNQKLTDRIQPTAMPRAWVNGLIPHAQMLCYGVPNLDDTTYCFTCANKLSYKINNLLNKEYKDVIRKIVVFASREVDMLDFRSAAMTDEVYDIETDGTTHRRKGYQWGYRDFDKVKKELMGEALMYKIGEISVDLSEADMGKWVELEIEEGVLENLVSQERLAVDSIGRNSFLPRVAFPYNGRLHLANYEERLFEGWLLKDFFHWGGEGQYPYTTKNLNLWDNRTLDGWVKVTLEDSEAVRTVVREIKLKYTNGGIQVITPGTQPASGSVRPMSLPGVKLKLEPAKVQSLGCMLSYPDKTAKEIEIYLRDRSVAAGQNNVFHLKAVLEAHDWYNMAYYINPDFKPIEITYTETATGTLTLPEEQNVSEIKPNQMKVSRVDNPLFFPNETVYKIGNGEIVGLAANAETLVGGQLGDAPLYVMCSDGVYGMFVDSTGQFAYSNSRIISRYVCNNAQGIQAIMGGVVMPTEWGMVLLSGLDSKDVSDVIEGETFDVSGRMAKAWTCIGHKQLVELQAMVGGEFVSFLQSAIIGYNYYEKELWVMGNGYSYVLGNEGHWTKRRETGVQLVSDFPNLYLLGADGRLYDLQREDTSEATETMFISRMVKAGTQEFKQTERLIARGEFKLPERCEIAKIVDLTGVTAKASLEKVWVENPAVTTLTNANSQLQMISGKVLYEKTFAVVEKSGEFSLGNPPLPFGANALEFANALRLKSEMWDGTLLRKEWTSLTDADANYPQLRFDDESNALVKFGNATPYTFTLGGGAVVFYTPDGWEGKYADLISVLESEETDNGKLLHNGYGLLEYNWNGTALDSEDQIGVDLAAKNNYRVILTSGTSVKKMKVITAWLGGFEDIPSTTGCYTLAAAMENKSGNWEAEKKNNSVTLAVGNVVSDDGLRFNVVAAKAGSYVYYDLQEKVAFGYFARYVPSFGKYTLEAGKYYRLGLGATAFGVERGGTYSWSEMQAKQANGEFVEIEAASGEDEVALVKGGCYWFKFKSVVGSEEIDVCKRYLGTSGSYTITWIEQNMSIAAVFETIVNGMVDVSGRRMVSIAAGTVVKARWMSGTTLVEKVVLVSSAMTKSIADWITWFAAASEYVPSLEERPVVGMYLFGSYDGYKWAMLGARERGGEFRDLGLEAHRVDCKYFRLVVCGKMLKGSSIEYIEQQVKERLFEGKIR